MCKRVNHQLVPILLLRDKIKIMLSVFLQFIFGNQSILSQQSDKFKSSSWKDKGLYFDLRHQDLTLCDGEQAIACIYPIEDVKGNPGELGILEATNLRLIYMCCTKKRVNISIGWRTVSLTFKQNLKDSFGNPIESLCVMSKFDSTKYEFIFRNSDKISRGSRDMRDNWHELKKLKMLYQAKSLPMKFLTSNYIDEPFDMIFKIWYSYKETQLFRLCRANLTDLISSHDRSNPNPRRAVNRLPGEEIIETYDDVALIESRHDEYSGILMLTNVRIVWFEQSLALRNLSMPYIRIHSIKLNNYKITISTQDYLATTTKVVLKTKTLPLQETTKHLYEQLKDKHVVFKSRSKFGPESCEDCINYMGYLRPVEHFIASLDLSMQVENFGPELNRLRQEEIQTELVQVEQPNIYSKNYLELDDALDKAEDEFNDSRTRISSYTSDSKSSKEIKLIYFEGLGLSVERPDKEVDLNRFWRIEL